MSDGSDWFEPKRYGFGSGLPIRWQGWATYLGYAALLGVSVPLIRRTRLGFVSIAVILTVALMVICASKTRGGWHWRWGDRDQ